MGLVQKELGNASEAIKLFSKALKIAHAEFGEKHPKIGMYENNLGDAYAKVHEFKEAERYFEHSLQVLELTLGKDHIEVSDALYNYAMFDIEQRRLKAAKEKLLRAAQIVKATLNEQHPKFIKYTKILKELQV
mgnify:FL=1